MSKASKVTDQTAAGQAGIRKKSKVPGVMITQFMEELPEGMSTPDFTRKPIALTIQEGKSAAFKAKVVGTPTPTITWSRANGEIHFHPDLCLQKYDQSSQEHTLEFPKVAPEDADTYKCFATNEYGRAICTVVLNVIEVGFSKTKELQRTHGEDATQFRKKLKKRNADGTREEKVMEPEEKVWEILLSADKKDYERICAEYGITDFRGMLKKLKELKREREDEIAEFVTHISTLKHIEVSDNDYATIELDMDLKDPSSKIFLYKDGVMVPFSIEEGEAMKHNLKQVGNKYVFTIKKLGLEDAGLYSVDVEGVNVFSTDFKVPEVDFAVKIHEVKAEEREDVLFQCVLTAPMNEIKWYGKNALLSNSEKHNITVSEDKLIHKLIVRDCLPLDAGIYAAVAGIKSCNAWLIVEANKDPANLGKKTARKTTMAGVGNDEELMRIAKEQQERYLKEMEEKIEIAKKAQVEREAAEAAARAEAEAARKAAAEAKAATKAAAKAAARSKRAAAAKDVAAKKTKKKEAGPASGGVSSAHSTGGVVDVGGVADVGGVSGPDGASGPASAISGAIDGGKHAGKHAGAGKSIGGGAINGEGDISGTKYGAAAQGEFGSAAGTGRGFRGDAGAQGEPGGEAGGVGGGAGARGEFGGEARGGAGARGELGGEARGGAGARGELGGEAQGGAGARTGGGVRGTAEAGVEGEAGEVNGDEDLNENSEEDEEYDSFEDSDEELEGEGEGKVGGEGRTRGKRIRDGQLIADTMIGDNNKEETTNQQGEKRKTSQKENSGG